MAPKNYLRRVTGGNDANENRPERDEQEGERRASTDGGGVTIDPGADDEDATETIGNAPDADTRLERAVEAVRYDRETERTLEATAADELGLDVTDLEGAYPVSVPIDAAARHTRLLSTTLEEGRGTERASRVASIARQQAEASVPPSAYVATYERAFERLVERTFDDLEDGGDLESAKAKLLAGLNASLVDMQVGVDEFADEDVVAPLSDDDSLEGIGLEAAVAALPEPAFLIDDENTVLAYNSGFNRLFSLEDDHREYVGKDSRETIAAAAYTDGRRHHSLADKIVEEHAGVDDWALETAADHEATDNVVYRDTSVTVDNTGAEAHVEMLAMPIYDADGEFLAVLELIRDRSDEMRRKRAVEELITEVTDTLTRIGEGDLSARAEFVDDHDVIESNLLALTSDVNEMATNFEEVVTRVDEKTTDLADSIERATTYADRIDEQATNQSESLETVADEMEDFSATMEEVAASSEEVAEAAESALEEVEQGVGASEDAKDVTDEVAEISRELVDTVEELDDYMNEIGEVAEVIADVADQTNLLALNANIEAAKANEAGAGFAVVANEVKNLAAETQEHTDEIATRIDQVQRQTVETVDEVETSHEHVQKVESEIDNVLVSLETISDRVESAADGIQEVAGANDKQAASVEEVMATLEDVRESSTNVTETTDEIVEETEQQEQAVFELADRVRRMSGDES
ncbi:methyl-accepting chemotaxis protein [Natrarchaeobaculum sulfurireducens]|uniref:MCP domain signal transducer n=1 Tax=Natrarchaeobaculum sulfurireducens TaxID=2044521 RepID=A0A346PNG4_9EURY|nr:methyl-accepting chemotaxis protein [Natrarchaeobaculum sulfurireducens]AXR81059.1 MCP domain signal transducer [Natrarchaeobaculum sulfurireducens]